MNTTDSITQAINDWLLTRPLISENYDIEIEELPDGTKMLALQRSGVELIKRYYKGRKEEYQYMLFLKENSEGNELKTANFDWLDDCFDFDYIEVPFKDFIGNIEQFCEKYVALSFGIDALVIGSPNG